MKNYEDVSDFIIQRICECGWKAYLTGGAVRDHFLEMDASDYDVVTDATPDELEKIFPDRKVNLVGASFLVTLVDGIEVATYRSDKNYGNGRHNCVTSVCKTLEEDLERRDFTFNAMAVCPYLGEVIDPFNGKQDLDNKLVKFVGNPNDRINEDYLRMLRALRFACLIDGVLDGDTFTAIVNNKHLIHEVAPERIRAELLKVMKYKKPSKFFNILYITGLMKEILPELDAIYGHTGGKYHGETVDEHCMMVGDALPPNKPILRLSGYLHDIGKPVVFDGESFINHEKVGADMVVDICKRFKFSIDETEKIKNLTLYHMRSFQDNISDRAIRRMVKKFDDKNVNWKDWFRLRLADKKANLASDGYTLEKIRDIVLKIHKATHLTESGGFRITDLAINGNDIMKLLKIRPGPQVGFILKMLLDMVLENPEMNNQERLFEIVKELEV